MCNKQLKKMIWLILGSVGCFVFGALCYAAVPSGIGGVAANATSNLKNVASLITAGAFVGGFGFAVAGIAKFKAHKDNPTQVQISQPIALLFIGAALIFTPAVFKTTGGTLFNGSGVGKVSGFTSF